MWFFFHEIEYLSKIVPYISRDLADWTDLIVTIITPYQHLEAIESLPITTGFLLLYGENTLNFYKRRTFATLRLNKVEKISILMHIDSVLQSWDFRPLRSESITVWQVARYHPI